MADNRMLSNEIIRLQGELTSMRPGTEEYGNAIDELKALQSIENDETRLAIDADKVTNDRLKIEVDDMKSRRDERKEYVKIGSSILGGSAMVVLVQLMESEKVIRSKAFQFATRIINKIL